MLFLTYLILESMTHEQSHFDAPFSEETQVCDENLHQHLFVVKMEVIVL